MSATSAPSGTLWATASKTWTIPPKPRPGRKPKVVPAPAKEEEEEVDTKGRRVQNRAAQRAFRERKQSQLSELQARIQAYEQGEIERNVALQTIAKRLKDENERLKTANQALNEKVATLERQVQDSEKKRRRDESPAPTASRERPRKRAKMAANLVSLERSESVMSYMDSPPSMASSPDSADTSDGPHSPAPYDPPMDMLGYQEDQTPLTTLDFSKQSSSQGFTTFDCGFCDDTTPCVCREIALQQAAAECRENAASMTSLTMSDFEQKPFANQTPPPPPSILDNLPAYQPAVALPRRRTGATIVPIFPVFAVAPPTPDLSTVDIKPAFCSGDPNNCSACAGDTFGQAFCAAIGESAATQAPCAECPCSPNDLSTISAIGTGGGCCGDSSKCGSGHPARAVPSSSAGISADATIEKIPTNEAWSQLKSHPNVAFADLALLADVVSRRSRCSGPRVVLSPEPEPVPSSSGSGHQYRTIQRSDEEDSAPRLVPEDVLMQCGRKRIREVHVSGVRDALRLLDAKF